MAVQATLRERRAVIAPLRDPVTAAWLATVVVLAVMLNGQVLTHYDNFSHWGLVIKVMLADNSLPTAADTVLGFPTYPLGAASLGYFANRVLGVAESSSMLAQAAFVSSAALPVVAFARRRWVLGIGLYLVSALVLLTALTGPTNLLVDSLVGALAGALLVLVLLEDRGVPDHPWAFFLIASALIATKNSGALFVLVSTVVVLLLLFARRREGSLLQWLGWALALAGPWAIYAWWSQHVSTTFPGAGSSKHSGSAEHLSATWAAKSPEDRTGIIRDLLGAIGGDVRLWLLLAVLLVAGAAAVRSGAVPVRTYRVLLGSALLLTVLWEVALGLMYLWSMPLGEAQNLAGFYRYQATLHLVLVLLVTALSAKAVAAAERVVSPALAAAVLASVVPLTMVELDQLRRSSRQRC